MSGTRHAVLRVFCVTGGVIGYGCLAAFVYLVGWQILRWFRDGEWTHVGLSDGLRVGLVHCCVRDVDGGRLTSLLQWLDDPVAWMGLHKIVDVIPASLALFAVSIAGNCMFIYCKDRLDQR